jgi:hypothetical protein
MGRVGSGLEPSLTRPRRARAECTLGPSCPLTRYLLIKPDPSGLKGLFFASNRRYPSLSAFTRTNTVVVHNVHPLAARGACCDWLASCKLHIHR